MIKETANNIRLGVFVISGSVLLIFALYMIGQNRSFFGSSFTVKARFKNVNGLLSGNNVRFSGIQCGTVKEIGIVDDTTIEVTMQINNKTGGYIRQNAFASIGNEGLMGNKVVNILPNKMPAQPITDGAMLLSKEDQKLDDIMGTLSATNNNAQDISQKLKTIAERLNNSPVLWGILDDSTIPVNVRRSLVNLRAASADIEHAAETMDLLLADLKQGKGVAGKLLQDEKAAKDISDAISHIQASSVKADRLMERLDGLVEEIGVNITDGKGMLQSILTDSSLAVKLSASLSNVEKGTAAFNEDMEALKHNFLIRGYFRKQAKKQRRTAGD